ncbi:Glucanosyltransferase-domain-containing protein [Biscogniauxia sp. FL1348]|nr:Glucanosyltransferase-domain-containing protein [Biscogniauxia sp. FL1348]
MASLVTPVTIKGRYFWKGDERFLIKGVVYRQYDRQEGASGSSSSVVPDPLADDQLEDLKLSIPLFKDLGLNTLLVYSIDDSKSHDAAMDLLAEAGVYVLACLETPSHRIDRSDPFTSYTPDLVRRYFRAADALARYANTLGLIVASEAINSAQEARGAPVIRALVRDVRRYMGVLATAEEDGATKQQQRVLPLGVSASSVMSVLMPQFAYLSADGDGDGGEVDFFSFNCYSWCGKSSMAISGYDNHVSQFAQTPIPIFLSQYGSNLVSPRLFHETRALCSPRMTGVFSGGIAYEFFSAGGYGLVKRRTKDNRWKKSDDDEGQGEGQVRLERTQDYKNLRTSLRAGAREPLLTVPEFATKQRWCPEMPDSWPVGALVTPPCPLDWEEEARSQVEDRQWVDVGREMERLEVEDLAAAIGERLRIGDTGP